MTNFKEFMNRFNKDHDNKIKAYSKISNPLPIFIIFNIQKKKKEKEGRLQIGYKSQKEKTSIVKKLHDINDFFEWFLTKILAHFYAQFYLINFHFSLGIIIIFHCY
jgi:hypothetical protein